MTSSIPTEYFIDESGNTGDLSKVEIDSYFSEQRMFSLAAFGHAPDQSFNDSVLSIKQKHRVQAPEIKAKAVYDKPHFIIDLLDILDKDRCPIFIELVDKHYYIVINIIERMIVPYVGECDTQPKALWMKNVMADYMALYAPPQLAQSFVECCQAREHEKIHRLYESIIQWAQKCQVQPIEVANGIVTFARDSFSDFSKLPESDAVEKALPIPDSNPAGKLLWILPNLTSFTNIYARINHFARGNIAEVMLFHDEQLQFEDILLHNKKLAEGLNDLGMHIPLKTADYKFSQTAALQFIRSQDSIGIQVADVLAGFTARYAQDVIWGKSVHSDKVAAFKKLISNCKSLGTGLNIVAPNGFGQLLGIQPTLNF